MAILSRATTSILLDLLEARFTRTKIERLLYEAEVQDQLLVGTSKMDLLLNVFRTLESQREYGRILRIVELAMPMLLEPEKSQMKSAMLRDGFVGEGDMVIADDSLAIQHKSAIECLIARNGSRLTEATLKHHLRESEELYRLEKWDASIGQARNFVEQLLTDVAKHIASQKQECPDLSRPVKIRDYLQSAGFFDEAERRKLVDGVYGYFSEEGSHPGVGKQSTARVCLSVLWNFGFYVLEKLEATPA